MRERGARAWGGSGGFQPNKKKERARESVKEVRIKKSVFILMRIKKAKAKKEREVSRYERIFFFPAAMQ